MFQRKQLAIRRWIFPEFQLRLPLQCTKITVQGMLLYSLWRTRANPAWARACAPFTNFYFCSNLARLWQKSDYICLVNCSTKLQSNISKDILLIQTYATFIDKSRNPDFEPRLTPMGEARWVWMASAWSTILVHYLYLGLKSNSRLNWISSRHSQVWPICLLDLIVEHTIILFFLSQKNHYIYGISPQSSYTLIFLKKKEKQLTIILKLLFPFSSFLIYLISRRYLKIFLMKNRF